MSFLGQLSTFYKRSPYKNYINMLTIYNILKRSPYKNYINMLTIYNILKISMWSVNEFQTY